MTFTVKSLIVELESPKCSALTTNLRTDNVLYSASLSKKDPQMPILKNLDPAVFCNVTDFLSINRYDVLCTLLSLIVVYHSCKFKSLVTSITLM